MKQFKGFFEYVKFVPYNSNVEKLIATEFNGKICSNADISLLIRYYPIELAYALALIEFDKERLKRIIDEEIFTSAKEEKLFKKLEKELDKAIVVPPEELPQNVITMNSKARLVLMEKKLPYNSLFKIRP